MLVVTSLIVLLLMFLRIILQSNGLYVKKEQISTTFILSTFVVILMFY